MSKTIPQIALRDRKRGDTFEQQLVRQIAGAPLNLTGYSVAAQLRTKAGLLVFTFAPTIEPLEGLVLLSASPAQTALWPLGRLFFDVKYTEPGGRKTASPTYFFELREDITR